MSNETKIKLLIVAVLGIGTALIIGIVSLFRYWPIYAIIVVLFFFTIFLLTCTVRMPRNKIGKRLYKLMYYPVAALCIGTQIMKPALGILSAYLFASALSLMPALLILGIYAFFSGMPPVELTLFTYISISSIILSNHTGLIRKLMHKISVWNIWSKSENQKQFVRIGEYVLQTGNVHFIVSLLYVVYLVWYALQAILGYNPILSSSIDNAILKAFLVYIAYTTMMKRYAEQEMSMVGMSNEILIMFHVDVEDKKEEMKEDKTNGQSDGRRC